MTLEEKLKAMRGEFLRTSGVNVTALASGIAALAAQPAGTRAVSELARQAHSLKGRGTTFGVPALTAVATPLEEVLVEIFHGRLAVTATARAAMTQAAETMGLVLDRPDELGEESAEVAAAIATLRQVLDGRSG